MTKLAWALIGGFMAAVLVYGAGFYTANTMVNAEWSVSKAQDKNAVDAFTSKVAIKGTKLVAELNQLRTKNKDLLVHQKSEVPNATAIYKPSPDAAPVVMPEYRFTRYAVCLWNSTGLSSGSHPGAAGADGAAACADAVDALFLSDVIPADALTNHLDNAKSCRDDRDTLTKAQAFLQTLAGG